MQSASSGGQRAAFRWPPPHRYDRAVADQKDFDDYAQRTHGAKSRLRRISHAARFDLATQLADPPRGASLLDYGCGDGAYLARLASQRPDLKLFAWHPWQENRDTLAERLGRAAGPIAMVQDIDAAPESSLDIVTILEVLEHLPGRVMDVELARIERVLKPGGVFVVTVPIEVGPGALGKNLARMATGTTHAGTSPGVMLKASLGQAVARPDDDYILSHIGFDHRRLRERLLTRGWEIERRQTSPLPLTGAVVNSQIGWRLRRPTER